jgi:hypothetical protein
MVAAIEIYPPCFSLQVAGAARQQRVIRSSSVERQKLQ